MFFVLNTGRAGSKTVAEVLSQSPDCECLHEPEPRLIEEAPRFRYGSWDPKRMVEMLRDAKDDSTQAMAYGETNNKLALVVPVLECAFPGSRYIWLVRDGRQFVASAHQRGWFGAAEYAEDASPWSHWRLQGDLVGDVEPGEWASWTPFERCCWIWDYTNRLIRSDLEVIGRDRWRLARIEHLGTTVDKLCSFLGVAPTNFVIHRANYRTTGDDYEGSTNRVSSLWTWHEWSNEQRGVFARRCGELMDELYPDWREGDEWRDTSQEIVGNATSVIGARQRTAYSAEIATIRADLADLKLLRGDVRALTRVHAAAERRSTEQAEEMAATLSDTRAELAAARERAQRAEQGLEDTRIALQQVQQELANALDQSRTLEADRESYRHRYHRTIRERNAERDQRAALEGSTSYQFGNGLVMLVKHPIRTPVRVGRAAWRGLMNRLGLASRQPPAPSAAEAATKHAGHKATGTIKPVEHRSAGSTASPEANRPVLSSSQPVYAYVALGLDTEPLRALARTVAQSALVSGSHIPLIVTDSPSFSLMRDTGVAIEYVPDRETWETHRDDVPWDRFRSVRLAQLLRVHQPTRTIFVDPAAPLGLPELLDLNAEQT